MKRKEKIIWCVLITFVILFPNPFPNVHGNTNKAMQWCSDGGSNVGDPSCSGALCKCIDDYLCAHNLTDKEFPTYVWLNAGWQYEELFAHDYFNSGKMGLIIGFLVVIYQRINGIKNDESN